MKVAFLFNTQIKHFLYFETCYIIISERSDDYESSNSAILEISTLSTSKFDYILTSHNCHYVNQYIK